MNVVIIHTVICGHHHCIWQCNDSGVASVIIITVERIFNRGRNFQGFSYNVLISAGLAQRIPGFFPLGRPAFLKTRIDSLGRGKRFGPLGPPSPAPDFNQKMIPKFY